MPPIEKQLDDLLVNQHNGAKKIIEEVKKVAESKEITQLKERIEAIERAVLPVANARKGDAGKDADEEKIAKSITEKIRIPTDGKDADETKIIERVTSKIRIPTDGKDADETKIIKTVISKIRVPEDGKPADETKIVSKVLDQIRQPEDGKDADEVDINDVVKKVIKEIPEKEISFSDLKDIPAKLNTASRSTPISKDGANVSGDQQSIDYTGAGVTVTDDGHGNMTVAIPGGGATFVDDETPTGVVNGINKDFEISDTPTTGSLKVYVNVGRMTITEDYTLSGTTITFVTAPPTNSIIRVDFRT